MAPRPRIFTIPPSAPFVPTLVSAIRNNRLTPGPTATESDPLTLARTTIYLPTQRACRLAQAVFLEELDGKSALLPVLRAIGDLDEDELIFADANVTGALELPRALGPLERRLLLSRLILNWAAKQIDGAAGHAPLVAATPAAALHLADSLAHLFDDLITRGVPFSRLESLVPDNVDKYWQTTLDFLKTVQGGWPAVLAVQNAMEPAERRDRLIEAEAQRLQSVSGPVIAAGSTASMPATALLLSTIARLPHGAVVLPGLDTDLDSGAWDLIGRSAAGEDAKPQARDFGHAQFSMHNFLQALGVAREEVEPLAPPEPHGRERLMSEALRPAAATEQWAARLADPAVQGQFDGVAVISAASQEEEALAIAVALREAVAQDRKAALITPDRALARRVMAALARWNVAVYDSAGNALAERPAGVFARLVAEAGLGGLEPATLLALVKHPLFRLGERAGAHARTVAMLERAVLRGPRPGPGVAGLRRAIGGLIAGREALHPSDPRKALPQDALERVLRFVERLAQALAPLENLARGAHPLAALARCHRDTLAALTAETGETSALGDDDGEALEALLDELADSAAAESISVGASDYRDVFDAALAGQVVRQQQDAAAQVRIFGLLEARLQHADLAVLGGMAEGVWPPQIRPDPWLNRPMRQALGLDLPERRIGLTAHDFAQALGSRDVILAWASKVAGSPTVPSRFLQRLQAVAGEARWKDACRRGETYLAWARGLDRPASSRRIAAPEPRPPLAARPTRLSVTEIEDWLRDPYTIYAKRILGLRPLDAVDTPVGPRERGSAVHAAIEDFTKAFAEALPDDAEAALLALGQASFAPLMDYPDTRAFWLPRFRRIAAWFAAWETARRPAIEAIYPEVRGRIEIPLGARSFTLTARADRIERNNRGGFDILDYKTGYAPTRKEVRSGLSPQLTLEAAILTAGGFEGVPAQARIDTISYIRLQGRDPAGEMRVIEWDDTTPAEQAVRARQKLAEWAAKFEDEHQAYLSLERPKWNRRYGDYDHLARINEWAVGEEDEGGEG